jgi:hypothetical protein
MRSTDGPMNSMNVLSPARLQRNVTVVAEANVSDPAVRSSRTS